MATAAELRFAADRLWNRALPCRQQFTVDAEENPFTAADISALTAHHGG
jgi:hypothetical protein